jgi:hypothetical protein
LERISGNLVIDNNSKIANFTGINNLKSVKGDVQILESDNLTSLAGLDRLKIVYGDLHIYYNSKLTGYCSLKLDSLRGKAYIGLNAFSPTWAQLKAGICHP